MTELEWLTWSETPTKMLSFLCQHHAMGRTRPGQRRLRLFACACARRLGSRLDALDGRRVIGMSERFADGLLAMEGWRAFQEMTDVLQKPYQPLNDAGRAIWATVESSAGMAATQAARHTCLALCGDDPEQMKVELAIQCDLVRCIVVNPFRQVECDSAPLLQWSARTVPRLVEAICKEGAFDRLPILGDALEEAGCTDTTILDHCRHHGRHSSPESPPHARGCWVIDWLRTATPRIR